VKTLKSKKFGGDYTFGKMLGKGMQASVYSFFHEDTQQVFATKITPIREYLCTSDNTKNEKRWKAIVRELLILESLNSVNVIKPVEFIRTGSNLYLV
jgi:serine/threonine protein kinase